MTEDKDVDYIARWKTLINGLLPRYVVIPLGEEPIALNRKEYIALIGLGILCLIGIGLAINRCWVKSEIRKGSLYLPEE